ncbi:unnamed protein product, partial [Heterosigma akashiwo]
MSQTMVPAPDVYAGGTGIRHSPMKGGAVKEADKPRQVRKPKAMNATQPAGGKAARTRGSQRDSSQMAAALRGSGEVSTPTRSRPTTTPGRLRRLAPGENANAAFSPIEKKDQFSRSAPLPRNVVSKAGEAGLGGETPSPVQPTGSGNISPPKLVSSAQPAPKSGWGDLPANNGAGPGGGGLGHKQGSYRWPNGKFSGGVGNGNLFPELTQDATSGEGRRSLGSASDGSGGSGGPVAGVSLLKGRRPYMEDEHRVVMNMEAMEGGGGGGGGDGPPTSFFGLFDGHAGGRCSKAVAGTLPQLVAQQPEFAAPGGAGVAAALEKGCAAANREWFKRADRQNLPDGSTGVAALTRGGRLWVANVGDSRAVLGAEGKAVPLSRDHKPSKPQERRRIMQKGGHVMVSMGVHRVNGVLAVSRAFGDKSLRPVIDAEPEVRAHELRPGDEFLVLGTDGLWDMVTNQEAVNVVRRGLADLGGAGLRRDAHHHRPPPRQHGQHLGDGGGP